METEKENETEREGGRKNARERKTEGGGGKDTEKLTQQKDKKLERGQMLWTGFSMTSP